MPSWERRKSRVNAGSSGWPDSALRVKGRPSHAPRSRPPPTWQQHRERVPVLVELEVVADELVDQQVLVRKFGRCAILRPAKSPSTRLRKRLHDAAQFAHLLVQSVKDVSSKSGLDGAQRSARLQRLPQRCAGVAARDSRFMPRNSGSRTVLELNERRHAVRGGGHGPKLLVPGSQSRCHGDGPCRAERGLLRAVLQTGRVEPVPRVPVDGREAHVPHLQPHDLQARLPALAAGSAPPAPRAASPWVPPAARV